MPPALYYRQSTATDIGAMAKRAGAKHLTLTHLSPPIGDDVRRTRRAYALEFAANLPCHKVTSGQETV